MIGTSASKLVVCAPPPPGLAGTGPGSNPALLGADFDAEDPSFISAVYALTIHVLGCKLRSYAGAQPGLC